MLSGRRAVEIEASAEAAIQAGDLRPGQLLPAVRVLAEQLEVSPSTVAAAYRGLRSRGLVVAGGRRGTAVSRRPPLGGLPPVAVPAGARDLATGNPDPALLPPLPVMESRHVLYGEGAKDPRLVEMAATRFGADGIPARHLAVVGGALDGIERVLSAQLHPGDRVAVEDPGYPAVADLVSALGMVAEGVRLDAEGVLPAELERALARGAKACVLTPRAQNPTGAALTSRRAAELRSLLDRHPQTLVVEDDHAETVSGAPAHSLGGGGRRRWAVVRSVSKSLGPDLRLALVTGDEVTVARLEGRQRIGAGWVSHVLQRMVVELWSDGDVARGLRATAERYTERRQALVAALAARGLRSSGGSGLNVWVPIPDEAAAQRRLLEAGYATTPGESFRIRSPAAIRITVATLLPAEAAAVAAVLALSTSGDSPTRSA